jgi:hypothetical protein
MCYTKRCQGSRPDLCGSAIALVAMVLAPSLVNHQRLRLESTVGRRRSSAVFFMATSSLRLLSWFVRCCLN